MSKYGVFSGPYFPVFRLNTEIYCVNLCIQSEYGKIRTRKNSVFGHFSRRDESRLLQSFLRYMQTQFKKPHTKNESRYTRGVVKNPFNIYEDFFCFLALNYIRIKALSLVFDKLSNMPLHVDFEQAFTCWDFIHSLS